MKDECINAVQEAIGRNLRASETKQIEDSVNLQMRLLARKDPEAWSALSPYDRLQQAATEAAKAMTAEVQRKQEIVRLKIAAHDRIENALNDAFDKLPEKPKPGDMLRVVSQLLSFDSKAKGMVSAETWGNAISKEAFGQLLPLWHSVKGFAHLFEDRQGVRDLVHELFGEDSGNAAAKAGAQAWFKTTDGLRDRANASGMNIGTLDNEWHFPQAHSQARIAHAGLDKYTEDTLKWLDRDKYVRADGRRMSDDEIRDFLRHAYDTHITDGQNKVEPGQRQQGTTANRQAAHRQIFFKDADSYMAYQGEYGDKNLWSTLTGHIHGISRDIALNEVLGPDAEGTFKYFNDRTKLDEKRMSPTGKVLINYHAAFNEALFDKVSGKTQAVNQQVQDRWQAWRNFQTAAKLGKVVFTALGDEAGMSATAFANKIPWSESFAREFKYLNPANAEDRAVAMHAGLGINGMIGGLNRFGSEDLNLGGGQGLAGKAREFTAKLATTVLRASGAEAMWDARRQALGSVLMSYLGKTVKEVGNFADLNVSDHGVLANKGVTESDWQVWKAAEPEDWGMKHGVLTPKSIYAIPDARIDKVISPRIKAIKADAEHQIGELNARDEQERGWISKRADDLSTWLKEEQSRFSGRVGKGVVFELKDLEARMSKLQENLEYARSYWKAPVDENTPGIEGKQSVSFYGKSKLRSLGVDEGRTLEAIQNIKAESREIGAEMQRRRADLSESMYKEFFERQAELKEFTDRAEQRMGRRAMVTDRIQNSVEPAIENARMEARRHASTMLLGHVLDETGMGVMDTGARERTRMTFGTAPGTTAGELVRSLMLFKGFSASMMMKHWARMSDMPTAGGSWQYGARLAVAGTIAGAVAIQLRDLFLGKDPENVASPQFWGSAILRGGGLGFYGEFLYGELTSHDTSLIPALAGPLGTEAEAVWNLTGGAAFKKARGERVDEGANLIRFAKSEVPNIWYTQAAMDHILWNELQEAASPGYLQRMQTKAEVTRGTSWYWDPQESLPSRAPDVSVAHLWDTERGARQTEQMAERVGVE